MQNLVAFLLKHIEHNQNKHIVNKEIEPTHRPLDLCAMCKFYVVYVFNFTNYLQSFVPPYKSIGANY